MPHGSERDGRGICPYSPKHNSTVTFVGECPAGARCPPLHLPCRLGHSVPPVPLRERVPCRQPGRRLSRLTGSDRHFHCGGAIGANLCRADPVSRRESASNGAVITALLLESDNCRDIQSIALLIIPVAPSSGAEQAGTVSRLMIESLSFIWDERGFYAMASEC